MRSYVQRFRDRLGNERCYFRPTREMAAKGLKRTALPAGRFAEIRALEIVEDWRTGALITKRRIEEEQKAAQRRHATVLLKAAKDRASKRGLQVTLSQEWIVERLGLIEHRCEVTGISFDMTISSDSRVAPFRPSLDRIVPTKGYVADNVRIVCVIVNAAIGQWGDAVFWSMVNAAANHRSGDKCRTKIVKPV